MPSKSSLTPSAGDPHILELSAKVILPGEDQTYVFNVRVEFTGNKEFDRTAYQSAKAWLLIVHDWADILPGPGLYGEDGPRTA